MSHQSSARRPRHGHASAVVIVCIAITSLVSAGTGAVLADVTASSPPERIERTIAEGQLGVTEMATLAEGLVSRRTRTVEPEQLAAIDRLLWLIHECGALPPEHAARWTRDRFDRSTRIGEIGPVPFGERVTVPIVFEPPRVDALVSFVARDAADRRGEPWPEPRRLFFGSLQVERWEIGGHPNPPLVGWGVSGSQVTPSSMTSRIDNPAPFDLPPGRHEIAMTVEFWACDRYFGDVADPDAPWPRERWTRRFETTVTVLPPDAARPVERSVWVSSDGQQRRYLLRVPRGRSIDEPLPLVVAFHGGGGDPRAMGNFSGLDMTADRHGFLLAYPFGTGRTRHATHDRRLSFNAGDCCGHAVTNGVDDVAFVSAMLDDIAELVRVDANRVYATGMSNGAMMAYRVAAELADRFAAIAPVAGPMGIDVAEPSRPVAVIHFHGTADEHAPYGGGQGVGHPLAEERPTFRSVEHTTRQWIVANGCDPDGTDEVLVDGALDGLRVVRTTWGNGTDGTEVVLVRIEGGGHTWPGRRATMPALGAATTAVSANELMWEFFRRHARVARDPE